jgi:DNA-binding NtrC family response regulator
VHSATLLVVSRSEPARRLLCHWLNQAGYSCEQTGDADDALARVSTGKIGFAVIDLREPDDDDLLFFALLRRRFPRIGTLVLHEGQTQTHYGASEQVRTFGNGYSKTFPSIEELQEAMGWLMSERHLAVLKPALALA